MCLSSLPYLGRMKRSKPRPTLTLFIVDFHPNSGETGGVLSSRGLQQSPQPPLSLANALQPLKFPLLFVFLIAGVEIDSNRLNFFFQGAKLRQ